MKIAGLQKISLIDYPGKIASVLFTQGCNFRCNYCHNPELVWPELFKPVCSLEKIFSFLEERKKIIEAVVLCGGEPTIQEGLIEFLQAIKKIGYLVKLDTNGSNPEILAKLITERIVDFIAMDIKAPLDQKYEQISGVAINKEAILASISLIEDSSIDYQFRTTFIPEILNQQDLKTIKKLLKENAKYTIQELVK